jgi:hypothetical protein
MLDSFNSARQKFREEAACEAALVARYGSSVVTTAGDSTEVIAKAAAADRPLDPLLEELASSCDSDQALRLRIEMLFERFYPRTGTAGWHSESPGPCRYTQLLCSHKIDIRTHAMQNGSILC